MIKKLSIVLWVTAALLTGCQTKQTPAVSPGLASSSTTNIKTPVPTVSSLSPQASTPPAQLDSIESNSEDIIDDVKNSDWTSSQSKVVEIKTKFSELKPILISASVSANIIDGLSSAIDGLETAVRAKKSFDSRAQANQISKYVPDVADYYTVAIPTDVSRLDYLGREILLNVESSDWSSASSNFETSFSLWSGLKLKLNSSNNKDISNFQSNMDALKSAVDKKDSAAATNQANAFLENVDVLETDFTNQGNT